MNKDMIGGVVRAILASTVGYAAGRGFDLGGLLSPEVVTGLSASVVAIWSAKTKRKKD